MGEQFDLWVEMVDDPAGKRWVIEARRPKLGSGDATITVSSLYGVPHRHETAPRDETVIQARVAELARSIETGVGTATS